MREQLPDGVYPTNSKGQTYGMSSYSSVIGYRPDLIRISGYNDLYGYQTSHVLDFGYYPDPVNSPADLEAYWEWQKTRPALDVIPLYDSEYEEIQCFITKPNRPKPVPVLESIPMIEKQVLALGGTEDQVRETQIYYQRHRY